MSEAQHACGDWLRRCPNCRAPAYCPGCDGCTRCGFEREQRASEPREDAG